MIAGTRMVLRHGIKRETYDESPIMFEAGTPVFVINSKFNTPNYVAVTTSIDGVPHNCLDVQYIQMRDIEINEQTWFYVNTCMLK
ncbi:MAG: hypothetical protein ACRC3J_09230 [Culicoidibacterales bacterium]